MLNILASQNTTIIQSRELISNSHSDINSFLLLIMLLIIIGGILLVYTEIIQLNRNSQLLYQELQKHIKNLQKHMENLDTLVIEIDKKMDI
jgi:predicted PurR-regulated permease PerM